MIQCKPGSEHPLHWKKIFSKSYVGIKSIHSKCEELNLNPINLSKINALFPIQLTQQLLNDHSTDGPVLKQYLPSEEELYNPTTASNNPVGDIEATQLPGVIKKYRHRVLLIASSTCPVHCRYCFRKDFPYPATSPNIHHFEQALNFCIEDTSINEVILSGGDPLSLDDSLLAYLFASLEKIPHIKTIRLHTKFPSIFPQRITAELLEILKVTNLNKVCVLHINHPDEITSELRTAAKAIKQTNTALLNQAVLLNQVNNNADTLIGLSRKLFDIGVMPYYLHMLDKANGTHHFQVSRTEAEFLIRQLQSELPGYLVPKLAQEIPGEDSKIY